jgi:hypothetical protein
MGVPGNFADRAPARLADTELFAVDATVAPRTAAEEVLDA